jgi:hypothetical protein
MRVFLPTLPPYIGRASLNTSKNRKSKRGFASLSFSLPPPLQGRGIKGEGCSVNK